MQQNKEKKDSSFKALLICRDLDGVKVMQSEAANFQGGVVVASDDPRVQKAALKSEGVEQAVFLEKMESFYCVADDVIAFIREINHWLACLGCEEEIPKSLLYWEMHCEGGDTGQRVLDLLLLMRSYQDLIDRFQPNEIILVQSANATWEDELLLALADDLGITIRVKGQVGLSGWLRKRVWMKWRPLLAGVYWSLKIIQIKLANLLHPHPHIDAKKSVMVQLVGDEKKHLNHVQPVLEAINASGLQGVALGWRLGSTATILRQEGITVLELETWVSLRDLVAGWIRTLKSLMRAKREIRGFLPYAVGPVKTNIMRGILLNSLFSFFADGITSRYHLASACRRLFLTYVPKALCPWTRRFEAGISVYQALPEIGSPLLFIYGGWPYNISNPIEEAYFEKAIPNNQVIWFTCSEMHSAFARKLGFLPHNLYVAGFHKATRHINILTEFPATEFRSRLGLKQNCELYIFLDPNYNLRGVQTQQEQVKVLETMLCIAKDHPEIIIIIKPHPSHQPGILESVIAEFSLPNVALISHQDSPHDALKASDIVISKFSTLFAEAMFLGIPGVGVILDNESSFDGYEDAVDYCYSIDELREKILSLIQDRDYQVQWKEQMKNRQRSFLSSHGLYIESCYALIIAEKLKQLMPDIENAK